MAASTPPPFDFTWHPSNTEFDFTSQAYLQKQSSSEYKHIAVSAIVFDKSGSAEPRVLLIQRAAHDSWPNHWEIPGGACDDEDKSILHGVARELWEESGLLASYIGPSIGSVQLFTSSSGKQIGKFMFYVEVEHGADTKLPEVKLDPNEHQAFVWATEDEVKMKRKGDMALKFTTGDAYSAILKAFEACRAGELEET